MKTPFFWLCCFFLGVAIGTFCLTLGWTQIGWTALAIGAICFLISIRLEVRRLHK